MNASNPARVAIRPHRGPFRNTRATALGLLLALGLLAQACTTHDDTGKPWAPTTTHATPHAPSGQPACGQPVPANDTRPDTPNSTTGDTITGSTITGGTVSPDQPADATPDLPSCGSSAGAPLPAQAPAHNNPAQHGPAHPTTE